MSSSSENHPTVAGSGAQFATTHWSVVLQAGGPDSTRAREALEALCKGYWYPLYAYVRRRGHSPHDAQDLTQAFFTRLVENQTVQRADSHRGRFRSFLLTAMKNFLADEWDKARAQKRGGGQTVVSMDATDAEDRYRIEPTHEASPDRLFDRRWALTLIEQALRRLEDEYRGLRKGRVFEALHPFISGAGLEMTYAEAGARLGMSEGATRVAAHRLSRRYREILREEIAHTVAVAEELDDEIRYLFQVLGG